MCMQENPRERRQLMGCGFEPAVKGSVCYQPPARERGYQHARPKICVGYTTNLPEVIEVTRAHAHWSKGSLSTFCGDTKPTDEFLALIEILDSELERVKVWAVTPKKDGGGLE